VAELVVHTRQEWQLKNLWADVQSDRDSIELGYPQQPPHQNRPQALFDSTASQDPWFFPHLSNKILPSVLASHTAS
jgi:hypothetical protein